ncbi:MAG TPA: hypothetical protein VLC72_04425 [Nitrosopumilaceae archaeon]|nr:hypothetical protein [Nitrosopumilaceae archaeon]
MNSRAIWGMSLAAVFVISMTSAYTIIETEAVGNQPTRTFLIQESATLDGFAGGYPFIDTTPKQIVGGHVALVDTTTDCGGEAAPDNMLILAGDAARAAAGELDGLLLVPLENTGIALPNGCVFHADINPADIGVPSLTDIVVVKTTAATSGATVTVTAEVAQ